MNESEPPCDPHVAGPLTAARDRLLEILPPEAETLAKVQYYVNDAIACSKRENSTEHTLESCNDAVRVLDEIESRHITDALPQNVADVISKTRSEINRAIDNIKTS